MRKNTIKISVGERVFDLFNSLFIISPKNVFAVSYEETTQDQFLYNISNFYLEGNNIIINGWAVTNGHQHLTGSDTHEYSIELTKDEFNAYSKFTKALFQHRNKKIRNALIDSRHIVSNLDKKEIKRRLNDIEDEKLNDYLTKRVVVLTPEEILFISKELNPIFNDWYGLYN